jgi:hypothetical protein
LDQIRIKSGVAKRLYWAIGVVGILEAIYMILTHYNIFLIHDYLSPKGVGRFIMQDGVWVDSATVRTIIAPKGSLGNENYSSILVTCCIPFMFNKKLFWGLIPSFIALYLSQSAMAIVACGVSLVTLGFLSGHRIKTFIACGAGLISLFFLPFNFSHGNRFTVWEIIMDFIWGSHWYGSGVGSFRDYFHTFASQFPKYLEGKERWVQAHNEYLELLLFLGYLPSHSSFI